MPQENNSANFAGTKESNASAARFGSLAWRILFWMSVIALGPLLIMSYQGYHCARQAIVESQEAHLRSVLDSRKAQIAEWLAERKSDLRFLAITPCARSICGGSTGTMGAATSQEGCNLLENMRQRSPSYETIVTYDRNWNQLLQTSGKGCSEEDLLPAAFKSNLSTADGLVVSRPRVEKDGRIMFVMGHPVLGADGNKIGYVVACLDMSKTINPILVNRAGLGESGKVYLLSPDGRYVSTPFGLRSVLGEQSTLPVQMLSDKSSAVFEYEDYRKVKVLGIAGAVRELDWTVVVEMNQAEAFAWLGTLRNRAVITGLLTLVVALLLAVNISRRLSQPLRELATVARRIATGRHEERIGQLAGTEAHEVGKAFNRMMDELEASHRRLVNAASLAAIGELSSSIVHEMRNPLSSVKMNLQALRQKVAGDPAYSELAEIATEQAARLEKMLSELLGYGKPLRLNPTQITFGEIAKSAVEPSLKEAQKKSVTVKIEDDLGQGAITVDAEQMRRALSNLVSNAVTFSPQGGTVIISGQRDLRARDKITISVSDEGSGIPDELKDQLFQPFFTTRERGTGLGLANVKKIVEYHGGTVFAENRPQGGAVFTIALPASSAPPARAGDRLLGGRPNEFHPDH